IEIPEVKTLRSRNTKEDEIRDEKRNEIKVGGRENRSSRLNRARRNEGKEWSGGSGTLKNEPEHPLLHLLSCLH
ncbi:unnamed protein product, partial [Heterotrigona itama]